MSSDQHSDSNSSLSFGRGIWNGIQFGIWLYGMAMIIYLLGRFTVGERWSVVGFLNNMLPWLALVGAGLAIIAMFSQYRWLLFSLQLPIIVAFLILFGELLLPRDQPPTSDGPQFTAASFNTLSWHSDPLPVVGTIAGMDADIVGLQELGVRHVAVIEEQLSGQYPYRVLHTTERQDHGVGLLTRYEVKEEEVFKLQEYSFLSLRAVLDVEGVDVTVFVIHPRSPDNRINPLTYDTAEREAELETLRDDYLQNTTGPVLLLCDCNMSDQSDDYEAMDVLLDDAFRAQGRGIGFTFGTRRPVTLPFLRVDYVWSSDDFVVVEAGSWGGLGASDHRPVKATLAFKDAVQPTDEPADEATEEPIVTPTDELPAVPTAESTGEPSDIAPTEEATESSE